MYVRWWKGFVFGSLVDLDSFDNSIILGYTNVCTCKEICFYSVRDFLCLFNYCTSNWVLALFLRIFFFKHKFYVCMLNMWIRLIFFGNEIFEKNTKNKSKKVFHFKIIFNLSFVSQFYLWTNNEWNIRCKPS